MTTRLPRKKVRREALVAFMDALDLRHTPDQARKYVELEFDLSDAEADAIEREACGLAAGSPALIGG